MEDHEITARFLTRDETVLQAVQTQYGAYLQTIALHILGDPRDAEECLSLSLSISLKARMSERKLKYTTEERSMTERSLMLRMTAICRLNSYAVPET